MCHCTRGRLAQYSSSPMCFELFSMPSSSASSRAQLISSRSPSYSAKPTVNVLMAGFSLARHAAM